MAACFYFIEEGFMKMSDVFELPMMVDGYSVESQPSTPIGCVGEFVSDIECDSGKDAEYVAHAINNHDRMADEIAELRGHLRNMADESMHLAEFKNKTLRASIRSTDLDEPEWHDYQTIAEADEYLSKTASK